MSVARTAATTRRIVRQLRRDPRTVALLLVVPLVLLWLLELVFEDRPETFDRIGPALLALFPFVVMFLVTSVTTLRERTSGTLERLLSMPLGRLDLMLGYLVAFGLVAVVQAGLLCGLLVPREQMGSALEGISWALPLSYAVDAMDRVTVEPDLSARTGVDVVVVVAAIVLSVAVGAATLRRRTA